MNSYELQKRVESMLKALGRATSLVERLQEFVKRSESIEVHLAGAVSAGEPNVAFQASQRARNELVSAINAFKSGTPSAVYRILDDLKNAASEFAAASSGMGELWLPMITGQLDRFTASLDKFVDQNKVPDGIAFMHSAIELNSLLQNEGAFLNALHLQLSNLPVDVPDKEQVLSVYLEIDTDPMDLAGRLEALQLLYSELCTLTKTSETENRLQLAKLEVGSIWLTLIGSSTVLPFVIWSLKSALGFMHRNFTVEGKIAAIPKQGDALKKVMDIKKQLEKAGIDTSQMEPELQRSGALMAGNLTRLLEGVPCAEVDGEQISIGPQYAQRLIEARKQNLLPDERTKSGTEDETGDVKGDIKGSS